VKNRPRSSRYPRLSPRCDPSERRTNYGYCDTNADWIKAYLEQRDFEVEVFSAGRSPYVYAERNVDGAESTVLVYAHFDGQPVDAREWSSPPFEPTLRDGPVEAGGVIKSWKQLAAPVDPNWRIYARSAGDDKAPVIALAAAIDALDSAGLSASVNLKLFLDGEEEAGSPTLERRRGRRRSKPFWISTARVSRPI
jgi:acetylornithine deacetylase/succinyl-diaminopimelate desuccinylase-like protein